MAGGAVGAVVCDVLHRFQYGVISQAGNNNSANFELCKVCLASVRKVEFVSCRVGAVGGIIGVRNRDAGSP